VDATELSLPDYDMGVSQSMQVTQGADTSKKALQMTLEVFSDEENAEYGQADCSCQHPLVKTRCEALQLLHDVDLGGNGYLTPRSSPEENTRASHLGGFYWARGNPFVVPPFSHYSK
jgi:hypothetical protein